MTGTRYKGNSKRKSIPQALSSIPHPPLHPSILLFVSICSSRPSSSSSRYSPLPPWPPPWALTLACLSVTSTPTDGRRKGRQFLAALLFPNLRFENPMKPNEIFSDLYLYALPLPRSLT
ncbi:hypothetical protein BC835DRAFT_1414103 [Cytidiella melzeri]|nr:hypothetical protein BC835DRAFT_1414103 [Cytidiella melzeri]